MSDQNTMTDSERLDRLSKRLGEMNTALDELHMLNRRRLTELNHMIEAYPKPRTQPSSWTPWGGFVFILVISALIAAVLVA